MRRRYLVIVASAIVMISSSVFVSVSGATASRPSVNGLTATKVTLGSIVTQSGPGVADFPAYQYGVEAYLYYVNHTLHGVHGRTLDLTYPLDDDSNPTTDESEMHTLVDTDKVFGIVGVSSAFFEPGPGVGVHSFLAKSGVPVFGYATENTWGGPSNFFADYGSLIDYASSVPEFGYVAKQLHATKVAVFALNYASSQAECQPAVSELKSKYGVDVVYSNLQEQIFNPNFTTDMVNMVNDHVNMVISCMSGGDSVQLSKDMQEYGLGSVPQIWLDGYDRSLLSQFGTYMNHVYLMLQHVPFEAYTVYPSTFPGLGLYFTQMSDFLHAQFGSNYPSYAQYEYDDVALMGWESANLFTEGLRAAGTSPTDAKVVAAINKITDDFGGPTGYGVTAPTNWKVAHTKITPPSCVTFVTTQGTSNPSTASFKMAFNHGSDPWICFPTTGTININAPVRPPTGTPGG